MNTGAYRISASVPYADELKGILEALPPTEFVSVHPDGKYASLGWKAAEFITKQTKETHLFEKFPQAGQILRANFKCHIRSAGFLAMEPDAWIKPHRDLRARMEFGCVRIHIPVVTHPDVDFRVSKKRVRMNPGELWALNTSYQHQVVNRSPITRVHFVLDAELNDWVWQMLPRKGWIWCPCRFLFCLCWLQDRRACPIAARADRRDRPEVSPPYSWPQRLAGPLQAV